MASAAKSVSLQIYGASTMYGLALWLCKQVEKMKVRARARARAAQPCSRKYQGPGTWFLLGGDVNPCLLNNPIRRMCRH